MKFNISAGHNPDNKVACGASCSTTRMYESTEAREIAKKVISILKQRGHIAYDCTCNNGTGQKDVLKKICSKCNSHNVDLDVSIHFNSGASDAKGNGETTGVEVLYVNPKVLNVCNQICKNMSDIGFENRGSKKRNDLYYLNNTDNRALLIEVCFVDDMDDARLYKSNRDRVAEAIVNGLVGKGIGKEVKDVDKIVLYHGDADVFAAIVVAQKHKCPMMKESDFKISGLKAKEVVQIGGKSEDANRFQTFKNAAKLL